MIDFECQCGAIYHSEEAHIGRCLRCIKCGSPVPILRAERSVVPASTGSPEVQRPAGGRSSKAAGKRTPSHGYALATAAAIILLISLGLLLRAAVRDNRSPSRAVQTQPDAGHGSRGSLQSGPGPSAFEVVEVTPAPRPSPRASSGPAQEKRPAHYNSLPSGTSITPDVGTDGYGVLTVENKTGEDAVVRLVDAATYETRRWLLVESGGSAQKGIHSGWDIRACVHDGPGLAGGVGHVSLASLVQRTGAHPAI
jgi:hypothetical protein